MSKRPSAALPLLAAALLAACGGSPPPQRPGPGRPGAAQRAAPAELPPLPDTTVWGVQVLEVRRGRDSAIWAGTYGKGIYELPKGATQWQQITARAKDSTSLSWDFVNSFAFPAGGAVWYGTVGNGWGRSTDGGKTWRNWSLDQLGPQWQYVAPDGMRATGDTVYIATADGLRLTSDAGRTWRCITGPPVPGQAAAKDGCTERLTTLPTEYLLALDVGPDGALWVGSLRGLSVSRDGGRSWHTFTSAEGLPEQRIRAVRVARDSSVWAASAHQVYYAADMSKPKFEPSPFQVPGYDALPGAVRALTQNPYGGPPALATSRGLAVAQPDSTYHLYLGSGDLYHPAADVWAGVWLEGNLLPISATHIGLAAMLPIRPRPWDLLQPPAGAPPTPPRHDWFDRPIEPAEGNPYIDQTYRYGSTMGGNFQQHQGVEFNNPAGTPVHAIGDGVVIYAGKAEAGANTVAIRHDRRWEGQYVFSVYYHNTSLDVSVGQHVTAGQVVSHVGNTGRATNDHLHLEVHVSPSADSALVVDPEQRFPPHTVNPQLWIHPMPGTGTVAGRVVDAAGRPVPGAHVHGLVLGEPAETPFSFAETYQDKAHPDPAYDENFAVGDVPAGNYLLGVEVAGAIVWRTVTVAAGKVTWVELRPPAS